VSLLGVNLQTVIAEFKTLFIVVRDDLLQDFA